MTHELYTSCTACEAVFEITLEQLGLANGAVRCGVCGETFNARDSLREAQSDPDPVSQEELSDQPVSDGIVDLDAAMADSPDVPRVLIEPPLEDDEHSGAWELDKELATLDLLGEDTVPVEAPRVCDDVPDPHEDSDADGLLLQQRREGSSIVTAIAWGALGALMLLLAAAQVTVYWRDQWIQVPWLNGPLLALNERLGEPLEFTYDVSRYRFVDRPRLLVDATPEAGPAQVLEVQAELANEASVPQPLPHLRLILEDRWGRPVASRTLLPSEYLPPGRPAEQYLQPEEQVAAVARVATEEASPQAYTLDICLPASANRLNCGDNPTE